MIHWMSILTRTRWWLWRRRLTLSWWRCLSWRTAASASRCLILHRIERTAVGALRSQEVPILPQTLRLTIVADDVHHPLQIGWHGMLGNVAGPCLPRGSHGLLRDDGLFADRTAVVESGKFPEAMGVDGMTAGQVLRRLARGKHVLSTDGTVVLVLVLEALVGVENADRNAHAAFVAMHEGFPSTDSAESALMTMEWFLRLRHPQVANMTMVFTEHCLAVDAMV
mmetsp:Transcript_2534/g.6848  ORF Transcript_2534/g.6848 Transcript_2534/m.6848 type:complete len:224 (+) Transcript_2534:1063-1734(+)